MTSETSGYIRVRGNISEDDPSELRTSIAVPTKHAAVVSYREIISFLPCVWLFGHSHTYDHSLGGLREDKTELWNRVTDSKSDFAHLYKKMTKLSVVAIKDLCINTTCFQLFFSFFHESEPPLQNLSSGLWNCSVEHYPRLQHHLECNLKTECRDGRDETEHCPFSSPECQGSVSLCGRCYTFVESLRAYDSGQTDARERGNEYCASLKGILGFPRCLQDWYAVLQSFRKVHPLRLSELFIGLYSSDRSVPAAYKYAVLSEDRTVFYHSFKIKSHTHSGVKTCLRTRYSTLELKHSICVMYSLVMAHGAVCEAMENDTKENSGSKGISLLGVQFSPSRKQDSLITCQEGHVTFVFLLCGSNRNKVCNQEPTSCHVFHQLSSNARSDGSVHLPLTSFHAFACHSDELTTLSYTLVCDFIGDCPDRSDELFCQHPVCISSFTCTNGQCLPYGQFCDQLPHCKDESDEENCGLFRKVWVQNRFLPSPALIDFDNIKQFTAAPMNSTEPCPESHYRCSGEVSDCLPVFTRCNGMYDCINQQDEDACKDAACEGFLKCRLSTICVHADHVCDGWPHCPMYDDELMCNVTCPEECLCQGCTFLCLQPFSAALFPDLRSLDATGSGMTLSDVGQNHYLIRLVLARCSLCILPYLELLNLKFLDISGNKLQRVNVSVFLGLESLQVLSLSNNPLVSLYAEQSSEVQTVLSVINLSRTKLTVFDTYALSQFPRVQQISLAHTSVHTFGRGGFHYTPRLAELFIPDSPLEAFQSDILKDLSYLQVIVTENYKLCCKQILPQNFDHKFCHAPKDEISSCEDLLKSGTYRGFLWLISCLSVTGNIFCFSVRLCTQQSVSSNGFSVFVIHLALADFLMGVYIAIIGVADGRFRGRYLHHDDTWKSSVACKVAGCLSLLSSEVSAFIVWLITLDRFIALRFPFSYWRFDRISAGIACVLIWLAGWVLALLPLLPVTSSWEFYSQTGICIPLPVTRQVFKGRVYSFSVLIGLNFGLFLVISAGQAFIYWSVQKSAMKTNSTKVSQDMMIARRLITVAVTDFMCWFPIGLCGILALAGVPIPGEVNVALAVFVLPLNSAINPFLYTFNTLAERRRKFNEARLLKWMELHADVIINQTQKALICSQDSENTDLCTN